MVQCNIFNDRHIRNGDSQKVEFWDWVLRDKGSDIESFRITDPRYKPADTSYLNSLSQDQSLTHKSADETIPCNTTEWYDYENQKALRLPDVGDKSVSYRAGENMWIGCEIAAYYGSGAIVAHNDGFTLVYKDELRPNNFHSRKAELEKKRVVDAVKANLRDFDIPAEAYGLLYELGYLRLPTNKD